MPLPAAWSGPLDGPAQTSRTGRRPGTAIVDFMMSAGSATNSPHVRDFPSRVANAVISANTLSEDLLSSTSLETLIATIVGNYAAEPIVAHFDEKFVQTREVHGPDDKGVLKPLQMEIRVPSSGTVAVLFDVPGRTFSSLYSQGDLSEIVLTTEVSSKADWGAEDLNRSLDDWADHLTADIRAANKIIDQHRAALIDAVRPVLETRWRRTRLVRGVLRELSIPLERTVHAPASIRLDPAPLSLAKIEAESAEGAPEWSLANDLAEGLITMMSGFSTALERLPDTANRLAGEDEETLRDVLLFILNANYRGLVTGETFIGMGKSDLLLRWKDRDAFVGECKIWKGPAAFSAGIDQLLTRYTLWRHTRVALVLFIRESSNATKLIQSAHETLVSHSRTQSAHDSQEPSRRRDYTVAASGDERRPVTLTLLPVVIPRTTRGARF